MQTLYVRIRKTDPKKKKMYEYNSEKHILFAGYVEVFNRVFWSKQWELLKIKRYPEYLLKMIESLYESTVISTDHVEWIKPVTWIII
jgi:hypothetical protein